jgi:hypothetical protein
MAIDQFLIEYQEQAETVAPRLHAQPHSQDRRTAVLHFRRNNYSRKTKDPNILRQSMHQLVWHNRLEEYKTIASRTIHVWASSQFSMYPDTYSDLRALIGSLFRRPIKGMSVPSKAAIKIAKKTPPTSVQFIPNRETWVVRLDDPEIVSSS